MNENIDLTKILKDCHQGETFWSPLLGEVKLCDINNIRKLVNIKLDNDETWWNINADGTITFGNVTSPEIMIYPSREQRDWSKFTAPWYKKEKFDPKTLKAFDRVLVRDGDNESWCCDLFSHIREGNIGYKYVASGFFLYRCCIPYNDETKHLVGKNDEAPEYYRYWEE